MVSWAVTGSLCPSHCDPPPAHKLVLNAFPQCFPCLSPPYFYLVLGESPQNRASVKIVKRKLHEYVREKSVSTGRRVNTAHILALK